MKETIDILKELTSHSSDTKLAKFLGVNISTVEREKRDVKTKLHAVLPMLEYLISGLNRAKLKEFLNKFKE